MKSEQPGLVVCLRLSVDSESLNSILRNHDSYWVAFMQSGWWAGWHDTDREWHNPLYAEILQDDMILLFRHAAAYSQSTMTIDNDAHPAFST